MIEEDEEDTTPFLDFLFLLVLALLLLVNPKVPPTKSDQPPPGNLVVSIAWGEGPIDVDLWIWSECEERPIGFSNRSGQCFSLLRDDLGTRNDGFPANYENMYSREVRPGRYVVGLHCYTCREKLPVHVAVEVVIVQNGTSRVLLTTQVDLVRHGQEVTAFSFELTKDGALIAGSVNSVFVPLYKDWKQ